MKKHLFVVGAIAVILATGAAVYAADHSACISTDKKRYDTEQDLSAMTITITNKSQDTIYFSDFSFEQIELRKNFGWCALENPLRGIRSYIAMELKPGETKQHRIQCFFLPDREDCKGRRAYRIAAQVYSGCPGVGADQYPDSCESARVIYSNVFKVKKGT